MDANKKLIKVLKKVAVALQNEGFMVIDVNSDSYHEGEKVDVDFVDEHVSDDGEREQWYASMEVTKDETAITQSEMNTVLTRVLGEPTHPFDHLTQTASVVNNWTKEQGYVLVVHRENRVEFFEDYTKMSSKRT